MTNIIFFRPIYKDEEIVVEDEEDGEPDPASIVSRINCFAGCSSSDEVETEVTNNKKESINLNVASQVNTNFDAPFEGEVNVTLDAPFEGEVNVTLDAPFEGEVNVTLDVPFEGEVNVTLDAPFEGEAVPEWPSWLFPIPPDDLKGWSPRPSSSFEILHEIGQQDSRCKVFKSRDIMTGKIVALKKFEKHIWDPRYVEHMAQEILILRRLDYHPNVMKLEGWVLIQEEPLSLYLVFEYMEHSLADLKFKFTEPQVKYYMHQLLLGLEYCHSRGVVHGNINGFNLLISNKGILKIAGFGTAASICCPDVREYRRAGDTIPVLYRAPEFFFWDPAAHSVGADLWSVGCILAELLLATKLIDIEELLLPLKRDRVFKGVPRSSLDLVKTLLAYNPDQRQSASAALTDKFFTTSPYACEPSSILQYLPRKAVQEAKQELLYTN